MTVTFSRYTMIALVTAGLSYLALATQLGVPARRAVGLGVALATLNTIAAFGLATWARGRSTRAFMTAVLGGTLGRMTALLAAFLLAVLGLELPLVPLLLALLGYYVLFLVFELAVLHRQASPATATR